MKIAYLTTLAVIALALSGCKKNNSDDSVVSQRYIHKYGYALSQKEWEARDYPGQVITTLSNGVTITSTYENGLLHGPTTYTFPHSQTVEQFFLYNEGTPVKEIIYSPTGMPVQEKIQLSASRYSITQWFSSGTPLSVEEYVADELLEGQYYNLKNEREAKVEKGEGIRITRDTQGKLLCKETFQQGYAISKETFYPNGSPESIASYDHGQLSGVKKSFAPGGEPVAVEHYLNGQLHGHAFYYENGNPYLDVTYQHGQKNGVAKHYLDGEILSQEISWLNDLQHGLSSYYIDGKVQKAWYYAGQRVSKERFDEFTQLDRKVAQIYPYYKVPHR